VEAERLYPVTVVREFFSIIGVFLLQEDEMWLTLLYEGVEARHVGPFVEVE
jgi:hypothetical protein